MLRPRRSLLLASICPPTARVAIGALQLPIVGKHGAPGWQHHHNKFNTNLLFQLMKAGCQALAANAPVQRKRRRLAERQSALARERAAHGDDLVILETPALHSVCACASRSFAAVPACCAPLADGNMHFGKTEDDILIGLRPSCLSSRAYHPQGHSGGASWPGPAPWE